MRSARLPADIRLELRFRRGAPGRIRTRDPLLRRHLPGIAEIAWSRSIWLLAALIVAGRGSNSPWNCRRWLPVWLSPGGYLGFAGATGSRLT